MIRICSTSASGISIFMLLFFGIAARNDVDDYLPPVLLQEAENRHRTEPGHGGDEELRIARLDEQGDVHSEPSGDESVCDERDELERAAFERVPSVVDESSHESVESSGSDFGGDLRDCLFRHFHEVSFNEFTRLSVSRKFRGS